MTKKIYARKRKHKSLSEGDDDWAAANQTNFPANDGANIQAHDQITSQIRTLSKIWRVIGLVLVIGLNVGILGEEIFGDLSLAHLSWQRELINSIVLLFFDAIVLFPILFETWYVHVSPENIELRALLWRSSRQWNAVTGFVSPPYMKFSLLRFGRLFYLLNKRALGDYEVVEKLIRLYGRAPQ